MSESTGINEHPKSIGENTLIKSLMNEKKDLSEMSQENSSMLDKTRVASEQPPNPSETAGERLTVALISTLEKLSRVEVILRNLLFQTRLPNKTILYLNSKEKDEKPLDLSIIIKRFGYLDKLHLEIRQLPGGESAFFASSPILSILSILENVFHVDSERFKSDYIIFISDASLLDDHTFEEFFEAAKEKPKTVLGLMATNGTTNIQAEFVQYPSVREYLQSQSRSVSETGENSEVHKFLKSTPRKYQEITLGNLCHLRGICYPSSIFTFDRIKEFSNHYSRILEIHDDIDMGRIEEDFFIGKCLHHSRIPMAVLGTHYPGNLQSENIDEVINTIRLVQPSLGQEDFFQTLVKAYFDSLMETHQIHQTSVKIPTDEMKQASLVEKTPRIYDVFMFNGEFDLLELRLLEHSEFVERFFLVEAKRTFTGLPKELAFLQQEKRYARWRDRIEYLIIDDIPIPPGTAPGKEAWEREFFCRNYARKRILATSRNPAEDWVIISDLDEIVNSSIISKFLLKKKGRECYSLAMDMYYYNCNWVKKNPWRMACLAPVSALKERTMQDIRAFHLHYPVIDEAGWHFSFFMTHHELRKKLASFAHTEYNKPEYQTEELLQDVLQTGKDLFSRGSQENCLRAGENYHLPKHIHILPAYLRRTTASVIAEIPPLVSVAQTSNDELVRVMQIANQIANQISQSGQIPRMDSRKKKNSRIVIEEISNDSSNKHSIEGPSGLEGPLGNLTRRREQNPLKTLQENYYHICDLRNVRKFDEGYLQFSNYYLALREMAHNGSSTGQWYINLMKSKQLPMFFDEYYVCVYHWEKFQLETTKDSAILERLASKDVYQTFAFLCTQNWYFYKNYVLGRDHFDRNMYYAGCSVKIALDTALEGLNNGDSKTKYNICLLDNDLHRNNSFDEVAEMLHETLLRKGYQSDIVSIPEMTCYNIILGLGSEPRIVHFPPNCLLLNLEQLYEGSAFRNKEYFQYLIENRYWDYNEFNEFPEGRPRPDIIHFGYCKKNELITEYREAEHDLDVVFLGTLDERRGKILNELKEKGLRVYTSNNCRGQDRINILRRAKIVLNIHFYRFFEIVRVGYLLNNHRFVISEESVDDVVWKDLSPGLVRCSYDRLISEVLRYLSLPVERKGIAEMGYSLYRARVPDVPLADL